MKSKLLPAFSLLAFGVFSLGDFSHAASLIENGDFTANASSYSGFPGYGGAPTDWTLTLNGSNAGENGPDVGGTGPFAGSGAVFGPVNVTTDNQNNAIGDFFFLENEGTSPVLYQSFAVTAGTTYVLTFDAGTRYSTAGGDSNNDGIVAVVSDGTAPGTGNVLFQQTSSLPNDQFYLNTSTGTNPNTSSPLFSTVFGNTNTFVADQTGFVTLAFSEVGGTGDATAALTNVNVEALAVPEPSMFGLGLAAMLGLVLAGRCRKIKAA